MTMGDEKEDFRIGRVMEDDDRSVIAELDAELHMPPPPFGSLVRMVALEGTWYGLVSDAQVRPVGGRPSVLKQIPAMMTRRMAEDHFAQRIMRLRIVLLGQFSDDERRLIAHAGQRKPRLRNAIVMAATEKDVQLVAMEPEFLARLVDLPSSLPANQLIVASLRRFSNCFPDPVSFLAAASRDLARLARHDQPRVTSILNQVSHKSHDLLSGSN